MKWSIWGTKWIPRWELFCKKHLKIDIQCVWVWDPYHQNLPHTYILLCSILLLDEIISLVGKIYIYIYLFVCHQNPHFSSFWQLKPSPPSGYPPSLSSFSSSSARHTRRCHSGAVPTADRAAVVSAAALGCSSSARVESWRREEMASSKRSWCTGVIFFMGSTGFLMGFSWDMGWDMGNMGNMEIWKWGSITGIIMGYNMI